jgi:hypothetical protein
VLSKLFDQKNLLFFFQVFKLNGRHNICSTLHACIGFQKRKQKVTFSGTGCERNGMGWFDDGFVHIMDIY